MKHTSSTCTSTRRANKIYVAGFFGGSTHVSGTHCLEFELARFCNTIDIKCVLPRLFVMASVSPNWSHKRRRVLGDVFMAFSLPLGWQNSLQTAPHFCPKHFKGGFGADFISCRPRQMVHGAVLVWGSPARDAFLP